MSFPVMVDTKCCEGSMSSRVFICEQLTRIICTRHTPSRLYTKTGASKKRNCDSLIEIKEYLVATNITNILLKYKDN